jgi:hypothetical protein
MRVLKYETILVLEGAGHVDVTLLQQVCMQRMSWTCCLCIFVAVRAVMVLAVPVFVFFGQDCLQLLCLGLPQRWCVSQLVGTWRVQTEAVAEEIAGEDVA